MGKHPGKGRILPIDAHARPVERPDGKYWRTRIQVYDATFGKTRTDKFALQKNGERDHFGPRSGRQYFDDDQRYWFESKPDSGVKLADTGTEMRVQKQKGKTARIIVDTRRSVELRDD